MVDGLLLPCDRRPRDAEGPRGHQIDRHHIEDVALPDRQRAVAFEPHERQRRAGGEALVPARERKAQRALHDRRAHDRVAQPRALALQDDHLLGERLREGVRVGPAPVPGAIHADAHLLAREPQLALARDRQPQRALVGFAAALGPQSFNGGLAKVGGQGKIVGGGAGALDEALAVLELGQRIERQALVFAAPRVLAEEGLVLEDWTVAVAGHKAGRDMDERGSERGRELRGVERAVRVHVERETERRVEGDQACAVEQEVDLAERAQVGDAQIDGRYIAVDHPDLCLEEGSQPLTVRVAQRLERFAWQHLVEDAGLGRGLGPPARQHEHLTHLRVTGEEHREHDLAHEAGRAGEEDAPAAKDLVELERVRHLGPRAFCEQRRRGQVWAQADRGRPALWTTTAPCQLTSAIRIGGQ